MSDPSQFLLSTAPDGAMSVDVFFHDYPCDEEMLERLRDKITDAVAGYPDIG